MIRTRILAISLSVMLIGFLMLAVGCTKTPEAQSISGVKMATVGKIHTDEKGQTVEQNNLIERIKRDNEAGSLKHLYVISPYSGQVILYSPVKGKVTTGGKRLNPRNIVGTALNNNSTLPVVEIAGTKFTTNEVTNEDGTDGSGGR